MLSRIGADGQTAEHLHTDGRQYGSYLRYAIVQEGVVDHILPTNTSPSCSGERSNVASVMANLRTVMGNPRFLGWPFVK
jgi:hypothetical protein